MGQRKTRLPLVPQRTTPGFVFPDMERSLNDCLGTRQFGQPEMQQVLLFFRMSEPECIYCGSSDVQRWDHLVAIRRGGETVLGNMVPSCARCDDSKRELDYDEWMMSDAQHSPKSRQTWDLEERMQRIKAYVAHFGYRVRPLQERLSVDEQERLARIRTLLQDLRLEVDALIRDYQLRNGGA